MTDDNTAGRYELVDEDVGTDAAWRKEHQNGDETVVTLVEVKDRYLLLAMDFDDSGHVLAAEVVNETMTPEEGESKAQLWCDENPKGVQGDGLIGSLVG